jgi:polysaccharide pyruvyl transferase WcaK-like protein
MSIGEASGSGGGRRRRVCCAVASATTARQAGASFGGGALKVLFINDSTSSSNWGDRAAAISLMAMVRAAGGEIAFSVAEDDLWQSSFGRPAADPACAATPERSAREGLREFIPPVVLKARRRALKLDEQGPERLIPQTVEALHPAAEHVLQEQDYGWPALLHAMDEADVAVIHGASLHGHSTTILQRTILFLAYLLKTRFKTPVVIVNHTADLSSQALLRMAHAVYPLFDDVVYRDPVSEERWSLSLGGRFAADTAFWFAPAERQAWAALAARPTYFDVWPDTAAFDPGLPYICLGGSSIFHERRDWASVTEGYDRLLREVRSVYDGAVVLVASAELDQLVLRTLAHRYDLPLIGVNTPVQQVVDILGNADAYLGGRWHAAIFALRGGAPLIALSSQTFKMQALAAMTGHASTFDALDLGREAAAVARRLATVLERLPDSRIELRSWADEMAAGSWDNVSYVKRLGERLRASESQEAGVHP